MAIENKAGEKVSAQIYAKEVLKECLDSFKLENTERFKDLAVRTYWLLTGCPWPTATSMRSEA